ncbi:MAG: hypothetical protein ACE5FH_07915 [Candidatus Zixiibacteriota bacterium]
MKVLATLLSVLLLATLIGCGEQSAKPVGSNSQNTQTSTLPDEAMDMLAQLDMNPESLLSFAPASGNPASPDTGFDVYAVTYLWGAINPGGPSNPIDWSGTLSVNGVAIIEPRHAIDFEPGEDSILEDSIPYLAEWVSITDQDVDGIMFIVRHQRGVVYFTQPLVTFATAPITIELDFSQLENFAGFFPTGPNSGVVVASHRIRPPHCPTGRLAGQWVLDSAFANHGHFEGVWMDHGNQPIGLMNGMFWTDSLGHGRFGGEVSGIDTDEVIAELHGVWYFDDMRLCPICGTGHGMFHGQFLNLADSSHGMLHGTFGDYSLPPSQPNMPLHGFWHQSCAGVAIDLHPADD